MLSQQQVVQMEEPRTWRELLGKVISDPQERQRIADAAGVNSITLIRWATNRSNPRQDNLRPLFNALPQHQQKQFLILIAQEYPHFFSEADASEERSPEISSAFYARVLNAHTTSPSLLRASSVCTLILQQIIAHLDPDELGMTAVVTQCMPPSRGGKVRSLRRTLGRGTPPWGNHTVHQTDFFGAESQSGHAVLTGHPSVMQSQEEKRRVFPTHPPVVAQSTVAYPILLSDRTAGSLYIGSTQPNFFTQAYLDIIQSYADLMVLAFDQDRFYDLRDIELGIMPSWEQQQPLIASFQRRVTQRMLQASRANQPITRLQAEADVWQELEEVLLRQQLPPS